MRTPLLLLTLLTSPALAQPQIPIPKSHDPRLKIELFAEAPDIVTPIGIDVDEKGRVYVIESHTHFPPQNYKLEKTDRIRVFEDTNGDRKADKITDFHTGETHTMGIALYRDGSLYVATRKEIFRLRDKDGDGKADERTSLVKLDTKGNYPHNGLSGFAFDFKGDVYFGFGENLGESYKLISSDGTTLSGGGEGGNIYVCDPEGKKLRRVATGFWNPFHLCFDTFGRLFAVDNDPDGRPPCRLLHIVEGGDYGYRFRYGRGGQHPFTSWNGEIPGTLPMIAGTGEAPSGMLAYESDNLPDDYLGTLLVTSWGDHRIEKYRLKPNGASFTSKMEPVITGGENFRPVGIALAPDGSLYVSDWVDKSYNVHGKGRVWRISAKDEKKVERPDPVKEAERAIMSLHEPLRRLAARQLAQKEAGREQLYRIATTRENNLRPRITASSILFQKDDRRDELAEELLNEAGRIELTAIAIRNLGWDEKNRILHRSDARDRLGITLALLDSPGTINRKNNSGLLHLFGDADVFVRHAATMSLLHSPDFQAEALMKAYSAEGLRNTYLELLAPLDVVVRSLALMQRSTGNPAFEQFVGTYLEASDHELRFIAIQWVAERKLTKYRKQLTDSLARPDLTPRLLVATLTALDMLDGSKPGAVDQLGARWYLERLVFGDKTPASTRAMAMRMLPANNPALTVDALKKLLAVDDAKFRVEVVRTLRDSPHKQKSAMLRELAADAKQPAEVRAEAIAGLDTAEDENLKMLLAMAHELESPLNGDVLRAMRGVKVNSVVTTVDVAGRPKEDDTPGWVKWLDGAKPQANAEAVVKSGERVFFSAKAGGCYRCHTAAGRGGEAGPDLSTIGKTLSRERLLESILQPSKEIAPRFAAQLLELSDGGEKLTLMYVGPSPDGKQIWADTTGKTRLIAPGEIESKRPLETSIMPAGLHQSMTKEEVRDLLAFLEGLK